MTKQLTVAVVGATGAVGSKMMEQLIKRKFPIGNIKFLASARSAGKSIEFNGQTYTIEEATPEAFEGVNVALFSAGGSVSAVLAPEAAKRGAVVIDNTSHFRMDPEVPLVVPEVNRGDLAKHKGIIANPNCSTIQMVAALEPIRKAFGLTKVLVSTYQAVSGAGISAIEELKTQSANWEAGRDVEANILPSGSDKRHYPIARNVIPQIDKFTDNGFTYEEMKMINETKKIMHAPELKVAATCVRVPVVSGHSESVYIEVEKETSIQEIFDVLRNAPGIVLQDDIATQTYPMPIYAEGEDATFVGRIRQDLDNKKGFHLWIVSDNLLKGAALNSIQIAEAMLEDNLL
ncbi:aspartate-semialdehyde dehydrogenase [Lysinibacillus fusiformis]|jgi:aspartate-semialdehyde dehydrogenase|uniref:aspartate-semialdehyde dehydrogenase n=1 Tax=Lysinibacillus TaxID=400634 RepID=UPI0004D4C1E5|nr:MULTISPECIES: aspartate-semialdehyde dehydrogenase [Lysinibacillus]AJK88924.1 aspartate-semialdehyde dehydrogenase [Lysinibacillus fusiformis]KAB0441786.1 aspartate-semialdehyde dehydrogenase [Lysinibacillus fusiformis]KEK09692.1 aspartate-semialdehyde dehydrogenase [Lysinibacillus sphaericus]KHK52639.1 aspartate-semialdehyde dehydrogenase [Lysinibacillus sp. A1]MCE4043613.1 aspartate-semialdehyde dehydrogenase [Lysinibacillus fusiformis]